MAGDPLWSSVYLLLKGEGTDGSETITDLSSGAHTPALQEDVENDTARAKYGAGSLLWTSFDAYLEYDDPPQFGSDPWCVECWVYRVSKTSGNQLFDTDGISVDIDSSDHLHVIYEEGSSYPEHTGSATIGLSTWTHIAVDYDGARIRGFVDGVEQWDEAASIDIASTTYVGIYGWRHASGDEFAVDD
jgi:hypothetical protein